MKMENNLDYYLKEIEPFIEGTSRENFLQELYSIKNVEELFQEKMTYSWKRATKDTKPQFLVDYVKGAKTEIRLDIIGKTKQPVIRIIKGKA